MGDLGKELPAAAKETSPGRHMQACVSTHVCTYRSVHSASTDWPPSPNRPCPGSVRSPSCRPCVPAPGRILAPASSALIWFWGQLSVELTGDLGERHSVTEVPASQSIPRKEAPLKRCRASPGTSPLQQKGAHRLLLPAKGSQARVPPATTRASLQLRGLGLLYLQKLPC